jgi:hypothetical protein
VRPAIVWKHLFFLMTSRKPSPTGLTAINQSAASNTRTTSRPRRSANSAIPASARESRLVAAAKIRSAPIFWKTIVFLLLILLVLASFSEITFSLTGAMALGCQGVAVTLLVALVFIFDRPFRGQTSVSPQPIIKVIAEMQNRTS